MRSDEWNVAIALPAEAVAQLYGMPNCGLPRDVQPEQATDVVYGVIDKGGLRGQGPARNVVQGRARFAAPHQAAGGAAAAAKKARMAKPGNNVAAAADAAPQRSIVGCWATVRTCGGEAPAPALEAAAAAAAAPPPLRSRPSQRRTAARPPGRRV